jgi:hypothetical protein
MSALQSILGQYAAGAFAFTALFFLLLATGHLLSLYWLRLDRLSIRRADRQRAVRAIERFLLFGGLALLYRALPFWMATAAVMYGVLFYYLFKISQNLSRL